MQVLLGQIPIAARDQGANLQTVLAALEAHPEVDLALFPEMALPGYDTEALGERALAGRVGEAFGDGPAGVADEVGDAATLAGSGGTSAAEASPLALIAEAAARLRTAVIVGFAEALGGGRFANSAACIDEQGELVGVYRKTHLFGDGETAAFEAGREYLVVPLAGVRVGVQICFDTEFPEPCRAMALAGADLLATVSANMAPYDLEHRLGAAARAIENRLPHVYVNRCGEESGFAFLGDSAAIDAGGRDLLRLGDEPQLAVVDVPIGADTIGEVDYLRHLPPPLPVTVVERTPA